MLLEEVLTEISIPIQPIHPLIAIEHLTLYIYKSILVLGLQIQIGASRHKFQWQRHLEVWYPQ